MKRNGTRRVLMPLLVAALAGCASAPPPAHFYTLSATAPAVARQLPASATARISISVGPVTLPESVDRAQLVIRQAENRVALLDAHRWAEPLKRAIAAVVADNLARQFPAASVAAFGDIAAGDAAYRVLIDVRRFESIPGDAAELHANWSVRAVGASEPRLGRSQLRETATGAGYESLVAAHSRALGRLSVEIAAALEAQGARSP